MQFANNLKNAQSTPIDTQVRTFTEYSARILSKSGLAKILCKEAVSLANHVNSYKSLRF